jgi:hypothetical protein
LFGVSSSSAALVDRFVLEGIGFGGDFIGLIFMIAGMFGLLVESRILVVIAVVGRMVSVTHLKINY